MRRESASRERRHGMIDRIKSGHARHPEAQRAESGQKRIDDAGPYPDPLQARHGLFGFVG